ncbi:LysR family substrate-binding domain-containing protein [Chelativorans sp. M5D2P16]|uniref:LysR family substrate-binding domain-containing protein n=1 Tax=Chelativorans sp. M5D2P16 TaxID=3095678 RepID=UPI002ACA5D42|nr:LysR family substrate-binding domain-containing protein [Chelativorans sp. M5D2P16]MDZ5697445.1 LysR family substrate-binding domain-containing protein [Chelativorans sp. M5D2P16]
MARKAARGQIGSLHLGFVENASLNVLPSAVSAFRQACPEVDLRLSEMISADLFQRLTSGRIDVALARPISTDPAIETLLVYREDYMVVLPEHHELARREIVQIAQLAEELMISAAGAKATYLRAQFARCSPRRDTRFVSGRRLTSFPRSSA